MSFTSPKGCATSIGSEGYGPSLTMGTLGKPVKSGSDKTCLSFDASPKGYQIFKEAVIKRADAEGCPWAVTGGNAQRSSGASHGPQTLHKTAACIVGARWHPTGARWRPAPQAALTLRITLDLRTTAGNPIFRFTPLTCKRHGAR